MKRSIILIAVFVFGIQAANHREAPIGGVDHKADISDFYAFVSGPARVTFILCLDPSPETRPEPFDPGILYEIKIDNNFDAVEDIAFQFRFSAEERLPGVFKSFGEAKAAPVISRPNPPAQNHQVKMIKDGGAHALPPGVRVFVGTVDNEFWMDLGLTTFDAANVRVRASGIPGVLTDAEDKARRNFASDTAAGYAVNAIAIEVPVAALGSQGAIGAWASTSRQLAASGEWRQVRRMGNPLVNELLIGAAARDRFSLGQPKDDALFARFFLDPAIATQFKALTKGAMTVPSPPRQDVVLALFTYQGKSAGPLADMLRLDTGVPPTPYARSSRLGLLGGDPAGYPNGRRLQDDVTDIVLRVVAGGVLLHGFDKFPNNRLGDGVNINDKPPVLSFPFFTEYGSSAPR